MDNVERFGIECNANLSGDNTETWQIKRADNLAGEGKRSPRHDAALRYAAAGIPIFPCRPGGKEPATPHSFKDATTDPDRIKAWWSEADYNIGIEPERAGLAVVDIDPGADAAALDLPPTYTVTTPRGRHLYYRGSLPPSAGKLAPHVDTRGRDSYVLLPPSMVDGKPYVAKGDMFPPADCEIEPLPQWLSDRLAATRREPLPTPENFEPDTLRAIAEAYQEVQRWIACGDLPVQGNRNSTVQKLAAKLHGIGVSEAVAVQLIEEEFLPHGEAPDEPIDYIVASAFRSAQNPPGSELPKTGAERWPDVSAEAKAMAPQPAAGGLVERFRGRWPDEGEALPDLEFWDDGKTLPKSPAGAIGIMYGGFGSHKTNLALVMALDAVLDRGARVCYAAGEGAHGVEKHRIPAHCRARGIATKDLRGRWRTVPAVPLFASAEEVAAFIEAQRDLLPNIVILDTLATAIAGEDENSSKAAAFLTANGPAGRIRDAFGATVLLPAHEGKNADRGIRGHSGFGGNVDFVLHVEAHESGAIKLTVGKMRDGADGFSVYFKVPPKGSPEVPVPAKITETEYRTLIGSTNTGANTGREFHIRRLLAERGAYGINGGIKESELAKLLAGPKPREDEAEALPEWKECHNKEAKALRNARNRSEWAKALCGQPVCPQWRREITMVLVSARNRAASGRRGTHVLI